MQSTNTDSEEENEYTVVYWRNRFQEIRPQLNRNWHRQLADFDTSLDSLKGANEMRAVAHGKASLTVTERIVSTAESMLAKSKKSRRSKKTIYERLRLGF